MFTRDRTSAIIVPARLASERFPRKLLHRIGGKPLILHVAERLAAEAPELPRFFAVEDDELLTLLRAEGHEALKTAATHRSGADRIAEANREIGADRVINVQADEPFVTGAQIRLLDSLISAGAPMATLAIPFQNGDDFQNPNQVKVIRDNQGRALYFSRAPVPYLREAAGRPSPAWFADAGALRHLGLYAYRSDFLEIFTALPPGRLESIERLEQLRVLEHGHTIAVGLTDEPTIGVDTPEDAAALEAILTGGEGGL